MKTTQSMLKHGRKLQRDALRDDDVLEELLTEPELAEHLKIAEITVKMYRYRGIGPKYLKLEPTENGVAKDASRTEQTRGALIRYRRRDVNAWEEKHVVTPKPRKKKT